MNDDIETGAADSGIPVAADRGDATARLVWARLTWERERLGLTVSDVAARLRLHPNQVRALEQESLAALPEAAYVRGFVRSYARILNIDPAPLLADLAPKLTPPADSVVEGIAKTRDYSPVRAAAREHASRRIVVAGAVVLLLALGALGWYATHPPRPEPAATPAPVASAAPSSPGPSTAVDVAAAPAAGAATPAMPVAASPEAAPAAADAASLTTPVPPAPFLKFRFNGPSWVEVKDAEGKVLLSQHTIAGAEHVIEGTPPFYVVIGDTTKAVVEVRGEAYDLAPYTRQNVARFTVN